MTHTDDGTNGATGVLELELVTTGLVGVLEDELVTTLGSVTVCVWVVQTVVVDSEDVEDVVSVQGTRVV